MSSSSTIADNQTSTPSSESGGSASGDGSRLGLKDEAKSAVRAAGNAAREVAHQARRQSNEAVEKARSEVSMFMNRQKDRVANRFESYRGAVEAAANKLHEDGSDLSCDCARDIQDRFERASRHIRSRSVRELGDEMSEYARRRPDVFFGGLLLAGLIVARFLKASAGRTDDEAGDRALPDEQDREMAAPDATE